jgi:hypothetical protein
VTVAHEAMAVWQGSRVIAVSAQKNGLLPISQQSMVVLASLGYYDRT